MTETHKKRPGPRIRSMLRQKITSGEIPGGEYLPPLRELSKDYGVTRKTMTKCLKVLEEEGLVRMEPRCGCRVLARANDPTLGCPIAFIYGLDIAEEIRYGNFKPHHDFGQVLQKCAAGHGWSVLGVDPQSSNWKQILHQIRTAKAWGLVLNSVDRELVTECGIYELPVVVVDSWYEDQCVDTIIQDNFQGGILAARNLVEKGYKEVAWCGPVTASIHSMERFSGARMELNRLGADIPDKYCYEVKSHNWKDLAREILSDKNRPKAILALWLHISTAIVSAAHELGLEPGVDFEMVGWAAGEEYERDYLPVFRGSGVQPAVFWDPMEMAEQALCRLEARRRTLNLTPVRINIPASLKLPEES